MEDEKTPTLPKDSSSTHEKRVNAQVAKMREKEKNVGRNIMILSCGCLLFIVLILVRIVIYYHDCQEEREYIDSKNTTVSEKLMDYTTDKRVDCTNQNPCTGWSCGYVKEHFHRTHEECEYDDWSDYVTYAGYILLICACLQGLCAKKATKY
jgi:hypothetical protein